MLKTEIMGDYLEHLFKENKKPLKKIHNWKRKKKEKEKEKVVYDRIESDWSIGYLAINKSCFNGPNKLIISIQNQKKYLFWT